MPRGKKMMKPAAVEAMEPLTVATTESQSPLPAQEPVQELAPAVAALPPHEPDQSPKPFSIAHNNLAGVRLFKFSRFKQVQLQFEREVPDSIRQELEQDHWRYRPEEGVFTKQFGLEGEAAAIITARRLFGKLCNQLSGGRDGGLPF